MVKLIKLLNKTFLILLFCVSSLKYYGQFLEIGPEIKLSAHSYTNYSTELEGYILTGGVLPSMGFSVEKDTEFWLSLKSGAHYSYKPITYNLGGLKYREVTQYIDLPFMAKFSAFDEGNKIKPSISLGLQATLFIYRRGKGDLNPPPKLPTKGFYPSIISEIGCSSGFGGTHEFELFLQYSRPLVSYVADADIRQNVFSLGLRILFQN